MSDTDIEILVTPEETQRRLSFCIPCENHILDVIPKCKVCDCSISMLSTLIFKNCPIEKW